MRKGYKRPICNKPLYTTSPYGAKRTNGTHLGEDLAPVVPNDPDDHWIIAPKNAYVWSTSFTSRSGNFIKLKIKNGEYVSFSHGKNKAITQAGRLVTRGQSLMLIGNTGNSTGKHVHVERRSPDHDTPANPSIYTKPIMDIPMTDTQPTDDLQKSFIELKSEIDKRQLELENKYEAEQASIINQINAAKDVIGKLQNKMVAIEESATINEINLPQLAQYVEPTGQMIADIIEESIDTEGLIKKYHRWVDEKIKSVILKTLLKYDIFVVIGTTLPFVPQWLNMYDLPAWLEAGILLLGVTIKQLITNKYDTNKDGTITMDDVKVLKKYFN